MKLELREVDQTNHKELLALELLGEQVNYIESVEECLREARECEAWRPFGIYAEDRPVGFAMYGYLVEAGKPGRLWLDRLLIDWRYQRRGYGRQAMGMLIARLQQEYPRERIYLSVYEENRTALRLYQSMGFAMTQGLDTKGEKIMLYQGMFF